MTDNSRGQRAQFQPKTRKPLRVTGYVDVWIISPEVARVVTHWTGSRTVRCDLDAGRAACNWCVAEVPRKLEHWILVQDLRARCSPVLCHLTPRVIEKCRAISEHDGDLWGRCLQLWRENGRYNGPLGALLKTTHDLPNIANPQSALPVLLRLWSAPTKFCEKPHHPHADGGAHRPTP